MAQNEGTSLQKKVNHKVQPAVFLDQSDFESPSQPALLLQNLQHHGWSPISILVSRNNNNATSKEWIPPPTKEKVLNVMESSTKENPRFTHRTAESGAKGGTMVEPKESLELKRMDVAMENNKDSTVVDEWCWAMSKIAQSVSEILELPENTLLVNHDDQDSNKKHHQSNSCLDLMRVFSYHQTPNGPQLGSSPHTDWGSWTIVWQDNVGGLETYSRENQQWEPVPTATESNTDDSAVDSEAVWHCIVHVGDMASLALQKSPPTDKHETSDSSYGWPSPEHRVQTSTTQKRASLVYFGYPPASTSIDEIQQRLKEWKPSCRGSQPLPLTAYYLLQNQSSTNENDDDSNNTSNQEHQLQKYYATLQKLSIQEVIKAKWNQVQRSNSNY